MQVLFGSEPIHETTSDGEQIILFGQVFEIDRFHLKAYHQLEAFFDDPRPYLEVELTSAGVIIFIGNGTHVLLVETYDEHGRRVELPSGKVDPTDMDIFHTARRECMEEVGLMLSRDDLKPMMVQYHRDGRGGMQFYTRIPPLGTFYIDEYGRGYTLPSVGTDDGRTVLLISEPLEIFLDPELSLLRYSRNAWANSDRLRLACALIQERISK